MTFHPYSFLPFKKLFNEGVDFFGQKLGLDRPFVHICYTGPVIMFPLMHLKREPATTGVGKRKNMLTEASAI